MTERPTVWLLFVIAGVTMLTACEPISASDDNAEIMEDAARSLTFSIPGNQAYMLEKIAGAAPVAGVRAEVAVLFGYGDNRTICNQVADYLAQAPGSRGAQYDCNAID